MASLGREKLCGHIEAVSQDKWIFKSTLTPKDAFKRLKNNKVEVLGWTSQSPCPKQRAVCEVQGAYEPDSVTVLSGGVEQIRILLLEVSESYLNAWPKLNNAEAMLPSSYYENFRPNENRLMETNRWKKSFYDLIWHSICLSEFSTDLMLHDLIHYGQYEEKNKNSCSRTTFLFLLVHAAQLTV